MVDEQKAFGCPPNRGTSRFSAPNLVAAGKVFCVTGLQKELVEAYSIGCEAQDHLLKHEVPSHRPKPPASGLRWPSAALPSHHTKTPVRALHGLGVGHHGA